MKKRSRKGLAAALVLTMALPVTAFGAETVQVDGYDRMEGETAKYQFSISNVTGKTTVAGQEAYVCQAPAKVTAVDELQTLEVTKYLSAGNALAAQGSMIPDGYTQENWEALYYESEGDTVVQVGTTYTIKDPGIYRVLGMYPVIAGGAEVYLVVESNGQTVASLTKPQYTTATPSTAKVLVNGKEMAFDAYTIGGNTYFKLRDIAAAVNGTAKNFNVAWNADAKVISLQPETAYAAVGGELAAGDGTAKQALPSSAPVYMGWMEYAMPAYNINGSTYFKLRDLCSLMGITVGWNDNTKTITVDSTK
ncbi:hypothetical protein H9X85_05075 [Anaerotignum lactatifermentans]|uniref:Copper amine oxidase-like N-terminal domain-containing protein n=1 Tax=Anaerotignum lactatifermentans TaxID=160404 RepID=A0ABS2G6W7_9FIRM|nr:hypothetical protein [Anaerotignum lactatifermentans]MBM6829182.1 hypothetical protein [Anaerotignum lactatifermentans]MBM6877211.1 hypothetical protein [Anaerotignum lactatifermentans]MBM6950584.1 hypothetical protein [Anaerotignum lactatifermentans]